MVTEGLEVLSTEIEKAPMSHLGVTEAAAIEVPHSRGGAAVHAFVTLRPNTMVAVAELMSCAPTVRVRRITSDDDRVRGTSSTDSPRRRRQGSAAGISLATPGPLGRCQADEWFSRNAGVRRRRVRPPSTLAFRGGGIVTAASTTHPGPTTSASSPSTTGIKLGYNIRYWGSGPPASAREAVDEAERLGFDSVWTAEAYGSDALTPLAWWGSRTERIRLGTDIVQLSARTPAATAMAAALTLDHLSGGRFILGLGASGPQVVEGWYGQPYPRPLVRTREFVEVVRRIVAGEQVEHHGEFYDLPLRGGTRLGKALKPTVHPLRPTVPIFLAAEGPKNVALAAEIGDGWLPLFFAPKEDAFYRRCLNDGFSASGEDGKDKRFEVAATVAIVPGKDVKRCADRVRPLLALYAGGLGARGANFHFEVFARMGYEDVASKVQQLYLDGRRRRPLPRSRWRWWKMSLSWGHRRRSVRSSAPGVTRASRRFSSAARRQRCLVRRGGGRMNRSAPSWTGR